VPAALVDFGAGGPGEHLVHAACEADGPGIQECQVGEVTLPTHSR